MCYGGIKRWNGFLHCSLGKCNTVFLCIESVCMSLSQTKCIKYSKYLWAQLWSSPLPSSLLSIVLTTLHDRQFFDWNQLLHFWPVFMSENRKSFILTEMCIVSCIQILVKSCSLIIHEMISYIHKDSTSFDFVLKYRMTCSSLNNTKSLMRSLVQNKSPTPVHWFSDGPHYSWMRGKASLICSVF